MHIHGSFDFSVSVYVLLSILSLGGVGLTVWFPNLRQKLFGNRLRLGDANQSDHLPLPPSQ
jgi:hypothetical protein